MNSFDELKQIRRILTIAQTGLAYTDDVFEQERLHEIETISSNFLAQISDQPIDEIRRHFILEKGYVTPKVDVRVFIKNDQNEVLLVQDIKTKKWALPGGFAEVGMSPVANAQREVLEEAGVNIDIIGLKGVFDTDKTKVGKQVFQYYKFIFEGQIIDYGTFQINSETETARYFSLDRLPDLSLPRTNSDQIFKVNEMIETRSTYIE